MDQRDGWIGRRSEGGVGGTKDARATGGSQRKKAMISAETWSRAGSDCRSGKDSRRWPADPLPRFQNGMAVSSL